MLLKRPLKNVLEHHAKFYLLPLLTRIFDVLCFFQALAEALKINSSVRDMNLAFNEIGAEGAQAWPVSDVWGSLA